MVKDASGNHGNDSIARGATTEQMASAGGFAITPSDVTVFGSTTRGIYVGGLGAVAVRMLNGDDVTFAAVAIGTILPIQVDMVDSTGTGASNLVGLI
jgi:hypothetical protein